MNKFYFKKIKPLEIFLPIAFLLPYLEVAAIKKRISVITDQVYLPSIVFIMLFVAIVYFFAVPKKVKYPHSVHKVLISIDCFMLYAIVVSICLSLIFANNIVKTIVQILWLAVPYIYSRSLLRYIIFKRVSVKKIVFYGVICFTLYVIFCTLVNITSYGFSLSNQSRLKSNGGGPVVLGYTIGLVLALVYLIRPIKNRILLYTIISILVLASILTGSRGGAWPSVLIFVLHVSTKDNKFSLLTILGLAIVFIVADPLNLISDLFPRLFNTEEAGRTNSFINCLESYKIQPIYYQIFGTGLSNFFPYQEWMISMVGKTVIDANTFSFEGLDILVQPHNTYAYILIELGILGLCLFVNVLIKLFINTNKRYKSRVFVYRIVLYIFLFLFYVESGFFVQPGSASVWWLIMYFSVMPMGFPKNLESQQYYEKHNKRNKKMIQ